MTLSPVEPGTAAAMSEQEQAIAAVLMDVQRGAIGILTGVRRVRGLYNTVDRTSTLLYNVGESRTDPESETLNMATATESPTKMLRDGDAVRAQELVVSHLSRRGLTVDTARLDDWSAVPHQDPISYGGRIKEASGRAACRSCGGRIAKGERALVFGYSLSDNGGFTASDVWLHLPTCGATR